MDNLVKGSPKRAAIYTMGCKVNSYESQLMTELLEKDGYEIVDFSEAADVYVVNTCTVTQIAARKSRQMIHRARKLSPEAIIVACGCYVDRDNSLIREGVIDVSVPNRGKNDLIRYIEAYKAGETIEDETEKEPFSEGVSVSRSDERTRAAMKVQDGCRQFCTYCIIPYVRGPLASRPIDECVREAEKLAASGIREIVLTGIHITSYGRDWKGTPMEGSDLADLILELSRVEGIERIRLGSLEPGLITPAFVEKVEHVRQLCPHFHMSLQSGCDKTLKAMNRKYTADEYRQAVNLLRDHFEDVAITTDVIVGFPGESEEDHEASLAFVKEMRFAEAHIFPYSRMEGTVAARRKDQIPAEIKKARSKDMLKVTAQSTEDFMDSMLGKTVSIILEEKDEETGLWTGCTRNYVKICLELPDTYVRGEEIRVLIDGYVKKRSANHDASGLDSMLKGVLQ